MEQRPYQCGRLQPRQARLQALVQAQLLAWLGQAVVQGGGGKDLAHQAVVWARFAAVESLVSPLVAL